MGKVISSKRNDNSLIYEIELDLEESSFILGNYDNIHLFSDKQCDCYNNISTRGKNCATKYFLIPKILRKNIDYESNVKCQRISYNDKIAFIYIVNKINK